MSTKYILTLFFTYAICGSISVHAFITHFQSKLTCHQRRLAADLDQIKDNKEPIKQGKIADQIQGAGGIKNWLVNELMKDRTDGGGAARSGDFSSVIEQPQVLSPAAKERIRKNEELNVQVVQATKSAGIVIVGSCLALLALAKQSGLTNQ